MPDEYADLIRGIVGRDPQERVRRIGRRSQISDDIAEDYLSTTKVESGHRIDVRDSPKGAQGFGQVMPDVKGGTTRTVGGRKYNLRNPDENIEAGLRYFAEGGNDPVRRRLHYFGGPRAAKTYDRTGKIPNISDGNMTATQYVKATGGRRQQKPDDEYSKLIKGVVKPDASPDKPDEYGSLIREALASEQPTEQPTEQPRGRFAAMADATANPVKNVPRRRQPRQVTGGRVEASGLGAPPAQMLKDPTAIMAQAQRRAQSTHFPEQPLGKPPLPASTRSGLFNTPKAMGPRQPGIAERVKDAVLPYTPGLANLDTPMGIKTDPIRGALSLGMADLRRTITPEEKLIDPDAEGAAETAYQVGSFAPAVAPYIAAGKAVSLIPALAANTRTAHIVRSALTFGGVEVGREAIRSAQTGEPLNPQEVAISTAIGAGIGGIAGVNPSLKKQIVAFIAPGVMADVARGTDPETATFTALSNLAFGLHSYKKAPRQVQDAAKLAVKAAPTQTVPESLQAKLRQGEATTPPPPVPLAETPLRESQLAGLESNQRVDAQTPKTEARVVTDIVLPRGVTRETQTETQPLGQAEARPIREARQAEQVIDRSAVQPTEQTPATPLAQPPRHVDLQPRRVRGEGKGRFKPETKAQAEERRQQVNQVQESVQSLVMTPKEVIETFQLPLRLYRGESETTGQKSFRQGKGLYLTGDREYAKQYGSTLRDFVSEDVVPRNPLSLRSEEAWDGWLVEKFTQAGFKNVREFNRAYPDPAEFVKSLGYDGVIIGRGKDATIVSYLPKENTGRVNEISQSESAPQEFPPTSGASSKHYEASRPQALGRAQDRANVRTELPVAPAISTKLATPPPAQPETPFVAPKVPARNPLEPSVAPTPTAVPLKPAEPPKPSITSARKEMMKADRAELDLPELPKAERKSWQTSLNNAKPEKASVLADEVLTKPRALNDEETASLVVRAQQIKNDHSRVLKEIGDASDPGLIQTKRSEMEALEREFDRITDATKKSGAEKGRSLASQKLTINQDFDLVSVLQRAKAIKGRELNAKERIKFEDMTRQIEELTTKLADSEKKVAENRLQKQIDRLVRTRKREETFKALDDEFAALKTQFAKAKLETRSGIQASGLASLDPEGVLTPLILKMARNRVKRGVTKAEQVVDEVYSAIKEHVEGVSKDDIKALLSQHDLERDPLPAIKTRLRGQEADLTRRLAEKDFTPIPRRKTIYDKEASELKARVEGLKRKIENEIRGNDSRLDTILAMRKAGMLTGLKTHARNIGGTGAFQAMEEVSRLPGSVADLLVSTVTKQRALGAPNPVAVAKSSYEAATKGLREAKQIMKYGSTEQEMAKFERPRELNSGSKIIDTYVNTVFRTLSAEDKVFRTYAYKRSILEQAKLRAKEFGKTAKELEENPTAEMVSQGLLDAEVSTFNNANKLAEGVEWVRRRSGPVGSTAIDLALPFRRTPANIASRLLESTPLGGLKAGGQLVKAAINKKMSFEEQRKFSQTIGRSVTGSGLIVLGYKLAAMGLATGLSEDDAGDREVQKAAGRSPLSIKIRDNWHQIGAFSPMGNLIAVGAALHREQTKPLKEGEEPRNMVTAAAPVGAKVLLEQPFLKGASGVVDAIKEPGSRGSALAGQTVGSFVPTMASDIGSLIDNKRRQARSIPERIQARIPGLRSRLPEDVDVFGRPLQSRRTAIIDPTLASKNSDELFIKELIRLDVGVPKTNKRPGETDEQLRVRRIEQGKEMARLLSQTVASREYRRVADVDKIEMLKNVIEQTRKAVNAGSNRPERPRRREGQVPTLLRRELRQIERRAQ